MNKIRTLQDFKYASDTTILDGLIQPFYRWFKNTVVKVLILQILSKYDRTISNFDEKLV